MNENNDLYIASATPEDSDQIKALLLPHYIEEGFGAQAHEYITKFLQTDDTAQIFVARTAERIAGVVKVYKDERPLISLGAQFDEVKGHILSLYIHPDFRQRGAAQSLLQASEEWAKEKNLRSIFLHVSAEEKSTPARALYNKSGFEITRDFFDYLDQGKTYITRIVGYQMEKRLTP